MLHEREMHTSLDRAISILGPLMKCVLSSLPLAVCNDVAVWSVCWGGWCTPQVHSHPELQSVAYLELRSLKAM